MPEPSSQRGNPITGAAFEAAFETPIYPMGGGLNLAAAVDAIAPQEYTRLTNVLTLDAGETRAFLGRPGLFAYATMPAANVHTISRVELPATNSYTRLVGAGTILAQGVSGAYTTIDTGYSGNPLTLLPHRPQLSGDPWIYAADAARMRMIRATDGLVLPIGLPAPGFAATSALATENRTTIANFSSDGTQPGNWTPNAGFTYATPPVASSAPTVSATTDPTGAAAVSFNAVAASAVAAGYYVFWGCPVTRNLNTVGSVPASDDDYIHLYLWFQNAAQIAEFRIYFVVSSLFSPSILPSTGNSGGANLDSYVKAFSQNDLATFISVQQTQVNAAESARMRRVRDSSLIVGRAVPRPSTTTEATLASVEASRSISPQASAASEAWKEFGVVGVPLRRGDFQRLGITSGRNWGTVTGIICMARMAPGASSVAVRLGGMYLTGGSAPDTGEATNAPYDYRYTNYDPRTGDEGNPSPEQAESAFIDTLRRSVNVTPSAYGDSAVRQRFYRRGGTLPDDWYFLGMNTSDGGVLTDTVGDTEASTSGTLEIDHYQPVPSVDADGNTILAQPVPVLFGPYNGQLFALGDPNRPGFVYACLPGEPGNWPPDLAHEVCAPSEELLNGCLFGGQPYVASRDRWFVLYPNLTGNTGMTSQPTGCTKGLAAPWAFCLGGGWIWFVSQDGVYRTTGGGQEKLSAKLDPLFQGRPAGGLLPVDYTQEARLRCAFYENELYIQYADTAGDTQVLILQATTLQWRHYRFGVETSGLAAENAENGTNLLFGALSTPVLYDHSTFDDDGIAIPGQVRTGAWDWSRPREEKVFGDQILDADLQGVSLTWTNYLNAETVVNPAMVLAGTVGRSRYVLDGFGTGPQKGRNLSVDLAWSAAGVQPSLYFLGTALTMQPDLTINRVTNWDDLGRPDESYLTGVTFDCDTGGVDRTIIVERDFGGVISTVATLTVNANGRHKLRFSWPALPINQVRLRPNDDCLAWLLYRADWLAHAEPPRVAGWDIHFENGWDQYYTGLDLYCDTGGLPKQIQVSVDGAVLIDPATGLPYWTVTTNGRQVAHLTLPWGRGHVFHFVAIDANPGLLYSHRWHLVEEPSEQANWNQPFTLLGTAADKWVKAIILEIDTFGEDKTITLEADGAVVSTFTVNTSGRLVRQISLPNGQQLGRVWRVWPTDSFPSRLYSVRPVFDEEPFALEEWITQQIDHGLRGFHFLLDGMITIKSAAPVTLEITTYLNQTGTTVADQYVLPSTSGQKLKLFVPFVARKGVLYQYHFLRAAGTPFWLYQEESHVTVQPWEGGAPIVVHPFGNADVDPTRSMVNAPLAAARAGGGTA